MLYVQSRFRNSWSLLLHCSFARPLRPAWEFCGSLQVQLGNIYGLGRVSLVGELKRRKPCLFHSWFFGSIWGKEMEDSLREWRQLFDVLRIILSRLFCIWAWAVESLRAWCFCKCCFCKWATSSWCLLMQFLITHEN